MKFTFIVVLSVCIPFFVEGKITITQEKADQVGLLIWKNECGGKVEGLTSWNKGEEFASMGIGHFIWYPKEKKSKFKETFPDLLTYLKEKKVVLPKWLEMSSACPWNSREEFYEHFHDPQMVELRRLLEETKGEQARFIGMRLEEALPKIKEGLSAEEQKQLEKQFKRVAAGPKGIYILMDYVNFKGEGVSVKEKNAGEGWGLRQVLLEMPKVKGATPAEQFAEAAKVVLKRRVLNSSPEKNEKQWLEGWCNRLESYK